MKKNTKEEGPTLWITDTAGGNYVKKVLEAGTNIEPGTARILSVLHDDWCGVFKDAACDCDPDIIPWSNDPWD